MQRRTAMMNLSPRLILSIAAVFTFVPAPSHAATIYSDLAASSPFFGAGAILTQPGGWPAASFTPSQTYTFTELQVAISDNGSTSPNLDLTITLASDNSGAPGTALETYQVTPPLSVSGALITETCSSSCPTLTSGVQYWVELSTLTTVGGYEWYDNNQSVDGISLSSSDGAGWGFNSGLATPAFDVQGAVPEPATVGTLGAALGFLAWLSRRKRA